MLEAERCLLEADYFDKLESVRSGSARQWVQNIDEFNEGAFVVQLCELFTFGANNWTGHVLRKFSHFK